MQTGSGSPSESECIKRLPRAIKIGAYDWTILIVPGEGETDGETDWDGLVIRLWPDRIPTDAQVVGTVLHECLHVIFDNEKLGVLKKNKEAREEQIVLGFEAGLVSLLRDNRKLLNWMKRYL